MGALLESGMVGNIGLKHLRVIKEDTIKKWDDLGFLDGLNGHQKDNIAQLYENQASYLINEAAVSDASGSFETVVFPIIRRVFSKLLANDIVSVQAMNLPIGKLFYFVPKIQERTAGNGHYSPYGIPGGAGGSSASTGYTGVNLYDRFYEASDANSQGLFDYSKGAFTEVTGTPIELVTFSNGTVSTQTAIATGQTVSSVIVKVSGFTATYDGAGKIAGPNGHVMDTEEFLASLNVACAQISGHTSGFASLPLNIVTQKYGKGIVEYGSKNAGRTGQYQNICDVDGIIYINVDLQAYNGVTSGYSGYTVAGSTLAAADFVVTWREYDSLEFEDEIGEVSFDLESVTVSVTERKLRASWSPELAQDVSAFHNIDAEAELTALLSEQIAAEIDREILRDLRKGAAWNLRWDYNGWKRLSSGTTPYTQKDWNQTLITAINQISAQIHKSTLRGGANWIIVSSEISAIFDDLEYFHVSNASPEQDQYNMGIERVGTLAGRYQVYRDPYFPANTVLIGHKGTSLLDTGYIYAPYVPLQLTPTMYNPFNFTPIKGIMTRYAKKMVNNRFYGRITVDGVRTFDLNELR